MSMVINEKVIEINKEGFISNPDQWEPDVASAMADIDGVVLTELHWEVIEFLRNYYEENQISPPDLRTFSKLLRRTLGTDKGNKERLIDLFSKSAIEKACQYAGLPKPISGGCG